MTRKSTAKVSNRVMFLIVSNSCSYALLNRFIESIAHYSPCDVCLCIEYVTRLVALDDQKLRRFDQQHKHPLYKRMGRVAMDIRQALKYAQPEDLYYDEAL